MQKTKSEFMHTLYFYICPLQNQMNNGQNYLLFFANSFFKKHSLSFSHHLQIQSNKEYSFQSVRQLQQNWWYQAGWRDYDKLILCLTDHNFRSIYVRGHFHTMNLHNKDNQWVQVINSKKIISLYLLLKSISFCFELLSTLQICPPCPPVSIDC